MKRVHPIVSFIFDLLEVSDRIFDPALLYESLPHVVVLPQNYENLLVFRYFVLFAVSGYTLIGPIISLLNSQIFGLNPLICQFEYFLSFFIRFNDFLFSGDWPSIHFSCLKTVL